VTARWLPGAGGEPDAFRIRPGAEDVAHLSTGFDDDEGERSDPPIPLPYGLRASAQLLALAGGGLARLPVEVRIAGLARVARSWRDPADALRRRAVAELPDELGLSPEMVEWALDAAFSVVTRDALASWWSRDGGDVGSGLSAHIWAGNVFVAGLPPVMASLLAGVPALIKAPSEYPSFAALFAQSVALHAPEFGPCVGAAAWSRDDALSTQALLGADLAFVFGDDASVSAVRGMARDGCQVHGFGHRVSVGLVAADVDDSALVGLLEDCLAYDGAGCLTPRWVFAVGDMAAAIALARRAMSFAPGVAARLPGRPLDDAAAAARAQYVGVVGFGGIADAGAGWCVSAQAGLEPAPPARTLCFVPVGSAAEVGAKVGPLGHTLQGLALAGVDAEAVQGLGVQGLSLIAAPGALQVPPLAWDHDGVSVLGVFTGGSS